MRHSGEQYLGRRQAQDEIACGNCHVSFDGGEHWGEINEGLLGATVVYSIVVDPQSNLYAATPYGIFKLEAK